MRKLFAIALLVGSGVAISSSAQARPAYKKAYDAHYGKKSTCAICHPDKKSKKIRNEYADALGKALGAKNVKDMDAIVEALKKVDDKAPKE